MLSFLRMLMIPLTLFAGAPKPPAPSGVTLGMDTRFALYHYIDPSGVTRVCFGEDDRITGAVTGTLGPGQSWISGERDLRACDPSDCMINGAAQADGVLCETGWGTGGDIESLYYRITPPKGQLANYLKAELIAPDGGNDPVSGEQIKVGLWRSFSVWDRCNVDSPDWVNFTGNRGCLAYWHLAPGNYRIRLTNTHPTKSIDINGTVEITFQGVYGSQPFAPDETQVPPFGDQRITLCHAETTGTCTNSWEQ